MIHRFWMDVFLSRQTPLIPTAGRVSLYMSKSQQKTAFSISFTHLGQERGGKLFTCWEFNHRTAQPTFCLCLVVAECSSVLVHFLNKFCSFSRHFPLAPFWINLDPVEDHLHNTYKSFAIKCWIQKPLWYCWDAIPCPSSP